MREGEERQSAPLGGWQEIPTTSAKERTRESTALPPSSASRPMTPTSLQAACATVPDPRRDARVTSPLPALLSLAVAAILCAHSSVLAIAEWGARHSPDLLRSLGFSGDTMPCQSTVQRVFRRVDAQKLAAVLEADDRGAGHAAARRAGRRRGWQSATGTSGLRAGRRRGPCPDGVRCRAECGPGRRADPSGQGQGGCQRTLCQQVLDAGGDYLLTVKAHQPTLFRALRRLFDAGARPLWACQEAETHDIGHGRTEIRHLRATADPLALPDWPGVAPVFRLERTWQEKGKQKQHVRYGITSLPPEIGTASRLLELKRKHWLIENRGHRAKDVTFGEDASLIPVGQGPRVMSVVRSVALSLLHRAGHHAIASRLRYHSQHPDAAVALLLQPPPRV